MAIEPVSMIERNQQLARVFEFIADGLAFQGESAFKIRAYRQFAQLLQTLEKPIDALASEGKLSELPGVGEAIEKKVNDWLQSGTFKLYDRVRAETPDGAQQLMAEGLSPRTVKKLFDQGIDSLEALRQNETGSIGKAGDQEVREWRNR